MLRGEKTVPLSPLVTAPGSAVCITARRAGVLSKTSAALPWASVQKGDLEGERGDLRLVSLWLGKKKSVFEDYSWGGSVRTCSLLPLKGSIGTRYSCTSWADALLRPQAAKNPRLSKCNPTSQVTNMAERQCAAGLGPELISASKDKQNKHSLLASAYKYRVNLPCSCPVG